ncbi:hypothetical protein [Roseobacter sp. CCS2]|uniref:hypothetical protein n=1 Tax=Roseobacter sp. CCS2 TaxID=391593 RepID=UPI000314C993|nr:hypothetical protein [Roseobacter sp. CCS2]
MDENNQVLDVTYGNFSCRLEGFDDSVETMKVVVSFFHDLAGHDRFMDTEPLAPDMDTLARLAEEHTGQPVEVEGYDNKVSLRAQPSVILDNVAEHDTDEDMAGDVLAEEPVIQEPEEEIEAEDVADDLSSVADKLQRMRAAAARKTPTASDDYSEDLSEVAAVPAANPLSQRLSELVQRTTQAEEETEQVAATIEDTAAAEDDLSDDDTVAQAQVSKDDTTHGDEMNVFSDLGADTTEEPASEDTFLLNDPIEESADDVEEIQVAAAEATTSEDEISDEMPDDKVTATLSDDDMIFVDDASEDTVDDELYADDDAPHHDAFAAMDGAVGTEDDVAPEAEIYDADEGADDVADAAQTDEAPLVLTSADEASDAEPQEDHDDYNDDDEFDLEAEVAKVEAEIAARQGTDLASRGLPRHVEDAMSRIMSQTDQHLNQPENRRHRDAFAQLKAAVAATEAARQLGDKGTDKRDPDEVYKDDLGAHGDKDKGERNLSTPLKLVKSQEIQPAEETSQTDAAASDTATPVETDQTAPASARLRQIATMKEAEVTEDGDDFAAFVASHGATDLADQLEAAGAYICFVEGDADFSRPQVMKLVQSASSAEISREDGLRSFGRLLRQARLIKLANGRFQVADNTQFRPDDSQAAQG